ncbi:SDR family NAD(P)-dependent oxidoreductase, partial [Bacillus haynesii]
MKLSGHTVLITGGASGIGFAFAERFMKSGNTVIVCGRRESKLKEAKEKYPELITRVCDVTDETERLALFEWIKKHHPGVNVLVNNAGIQQRYHILKADIIDNWADYNKEITVNMEAPIHLAMLFSQYFAEKPGKTAIINVTS